MNISQLLREYRFHVGFTQKEMAADVISESFYSRVERGTREIDAKDLVKLLEVHKFDVATFFRRLSKSDESYFETESQIVFAMNTKNIAKIHEIERELRKEGINPPNWLEFRLKLASAWITHSSEEVSPAMQDKIKKLIINENWDRTSFYFLSQAVILMNIDDARKLIDSAYQAFYRNPSTDAPILETISIMAINYMNCCYHEKVGKEYIVSSVKFLRSLPITPEIGFFSILCTYYEALFDHDQQLQDRIIDILQRSRYLSLIQDTIEK
ncbi:helix-turn-helix domain-containing protein [Lactobacillus kitasatonis]|uniref:Xre family transcriptional regulator n=1 Tax=Lactobacillus kitasatonis DSM 16761 = JCM 1039 TaxID=1423767 RepID=A0A0R1V9M2_9LACO|nr:helix-turn-helix transcriptional regulator [Lactobacillus kitasatonis]KRM02210.1 xre family transcriptional regulator [Lactobacillus kitasatonis DSM 16761 = JCM 1039]